jgi:hypothetical protein
MTRINIWGPACWLFFHTLLAKIKPEEFLNIRDSLMSQLQAICSNLPCPSCSNHSRQFFQRQGSLQFKTKDEMIGFFWFFHNYVNAKKRKPSFSFSGLEKYNSENLRNAYTNFANQYTAKDTGLKLMSETFHRKGILRGFHQWMLQNNRSFYA